MKHAPIVDNLGRTQRARVIGGPDLYRLIIGSKYSLALLDNKKGVHTMGTPGDHQELSAVKEPDFRGHSIRTINQDEEPWFVSKDVCDVLGIGNVSQTLSYLDDDEKGITTNDTLGGVQELLVVNEPGLYSLIIRSRKPEAKAFKRWITHEVIPTIRKTGGAYLTAEKAEELLGNPDLIIGLAQQVKELYEITVVGHSL